jgi:hypothetical protein
LLFRVYRETLSRFRAPLQAAMWFMDFQLELFLT